MSLGEFCNREVVVVAKEASAREAARLMREFHVGDLVVVEPRGEAQIPVGMLTDRDLVVEVMAEAVDPQAVTIGDVMSRELVTAGEDEELLDVVGRMRSHGVRRLPVVDGEGALAGILAVDDLIELLAEQVNGLAGLVRREQRRERQQRP